MHIRFHITAFAASIVMLGCDRPGPLEVERDQSRAPVRDPVVSTNRVEPAAREEFLAEMRSQIDKLDAEIDRLAAKTEPLRAEARAEAENTLNVLRQKRDDLKVRFEAAREASEPAWAEIKAGFSNALEDLKRAFNNAEEKFRSRDQ